MNGGRKGWKGRFVCDFVTIRGFLRLREADDDRTLGTRKRGAGAAHGARFRAAFESPHRRQRARQELSTGCRLVGVDPALAPGSESAHDVWASGQTPWRRRSFIDSAWTPQGSWPRSHNRIQHVSVFTFRSSMVCRVGTAFHPRRACRLRARGRLVFGMDFARNYPRQRSETGQFEYRPPFVFTDAEVWDGLRHTVDGRSVPVCNGLLYDWATWVHANDENARSMASVLWALSPDQDSGRGLKPGSPVRVSVDDARDIPTIWTDYAGQVPIIHASSGIRRIVALAYLLTWSWSEHRIASELRGETPSRRAIMLFDEVESHLHPRWQRSILKALLTVGSVLQGSVDVQLVVSTHSPLVLASTEPWFDSERDAWFDLDLEGDPPRATLNRRAYTPHGTAGSWLTSDAFRLATDRSLEAEQAILRARAILRQNDASLSDVMEIHSDLRATLPDVDRFWVRWNAFVESRGGTP